VALQLTALLMLSYFVFRWSAEFGAHRNGSPELHVMLAEYVYSESPELVGLRSKFAINFWLK
jgi:hypothetical protein